MTKYGADTDTGADTGNIANANGGIVMDGASMEFNAYNVATTVGHFKMGGRHAVFEFLSVEETHQARTK
jgi:hypothetical protein